MQDCNALESGDHVQQTNAENDRTDENNTCSATKVVATPGECNDNDLMSSPTSHDYANCSTDCLLTNCTDVHRNGQLGQSIDLISYNIDNVCAQQQQTTIITITRHS